MTEIRHRQSQEPGVSPAVIVGGLVAIAALATAAILFVSGDASVERLGLLFAMFGLMIPNLIAALRADHAATQTAASSNIATALNGEFEQRVAFAVDRVLAARSHNDRAADPNTPRAAPPVIKSPIDGDDAGA